MGSIEEPKANVFITGACGFIGQALAKALAKDPTVGRLLLADTFQKPLPIPTDVPATSVNMEMVTGDLSDLSTCRRLIGPGITHIYLLHGIMSGQAETNLELGMKVNIDSMRNILDVVSQQQRSKPIRIIFPSSLAVFGPAKEREIVTETTMPLPKSSYGAQKSIVEILLNDYSRRGLVDARILRLPTIIVRPGKPTGAASSFFSGIIREPLNGEVSVLPVHRDLKAWVCSARTVIQNLVTAKDITEERFQGKSRIVNLPGQTVTVQQMLDGLCGVREEALSLVREEYDENVAKIVGSWPAEFDTSLAKELGFQSDVSLDRVFRDYIMDYMKETSQFTQ